MISSLLRAASYALAAYLFFLIAFPDWVLNPAHWVMLAVLFGSVLAVTAAHRMLIVPTPTGLVLFELSLMLGSLLYVGWTLPQRAERPPILLWVEGQRISRSMAKKGVSRLGLDAERPPGRLVVGLFPK